jgi:hypothetical protein
LLPGLVGQALLVKDLAALPQLLQLAQLEQTQA